MPSTGRFRLLLLTVAAVAWSALHAVPAVAQDEVDTEPEDVPVQASIEVQSADAATTGSVLLKLAFVVEEDVGRAYSISLRLRSYDGSVVVNLDHRPDPPTRQWKQGQTVRYEMPARLPVLAEYEDFDELGIRIGFRNPETRKVLPPRNDLPQSKGFVEVGSVPVPDTSALEEAEQVAAVLASAQVLAKAGRKAQAWGALDAGLRRATEDAVKRRFRDALLALGSFEPRPINLVEQQIVEKRVADERSRYLRQTSGRFFDRGQFHAALLVLEEIGGKLEEDADKAVIGALSAAKRAEKDRWDVRDKLLAQLTDEEKAAADEAIGRLGESHSLLQKAEQWFGKQKYAQARRVFKEMSFAEDDDIRAKAHERIKVLDAAWVADVPADQRKAVDDALAHPSFPRTVAVASHEFIFIGPRTLVQGIPGDSKLRFDVAYIFLTDLFGRLPNPDGDRVTVYFKELWSFGGGVGGGKIIDIGKAQPARRGMRIDNGLLYHELTHCIDDTKPILAGFREGLANVGAAYAYEALGQRSDGLHSFARNVLAFRKDYLERDLPYWRIQNYGPSAGFFLHFLEEYRKTKDGHDWKPYREFFRAYRDAPVRDGREPYVARALAYYLVRAFGPKAFDDLMRFRFPLVESDRAAIELEMEAFADGERAVVRAEGDLDEFDNSPLRRDLIARRIIELMNAGGRDDEVRRRSREELGVVQQWRVIGPFQKAGADPGAAVFPPQDEIDFTKEYPGKGNICRWRKVGDPGPVQIDPMGWVSIKYPYMDNTAQYAVCHLTVEEETDAAAHVRADDDFTLYLNDELIDGYKSRGRNGSSMLWWRGPRERAPDAMRLPLTLRKGRNKVLLKIRNRGGPAGFIASFTRRNGRPIVGLAVDVELPTPTDAVDPKAAKERWKTALQHDFKSKSIKSKFVATVGKFAVKNKRLAGQSTKKGVGWRQYTVRPGFEKDSPSNLLWIRENRTEGVDDFRLAIDVTPPANQAPKLVVTFQGDGGKDGLSGWNLILHASGKGKVAAELERYDNLVHQAAPQALGPADDDDGRRSLVLTYEQRRLTVRLGAVTIFDRVPIRPIPGRSRIGLCTWGPQPPIERIKLEVPKKGK